MELCQCAVNAVKTEVENDKPQTELWFLVQSCFLNTITTLSKTVIVLVLQISADDTAATDKKQILVSLLNLIKASFGVGERRREGLKITHFSLIWPVARR